MTAKFAIGDAVWHARAGQTDKWVTCPDCFGKRVLRVILGDDTEVSIDCSGCALGYEAPRGVVRTYEFSANIVRAEIDGVRISHDKVEYTVNSCYVADEQDLFADEGSAHARAAELVAKHEADEKRAFDRKDKDTRTWAFNVSYHRGCIKRAQHDLEYHTAKLNAAKLKAKDVTV